MIKTLFLFLYTIYFWGLIIWTFLTQFSLSILFTPFFFKNRPDGFYFFTHKVCRAMFILSGLKRHIEGFDNIPTDTNFVIAANHQSLMDILFLCAYFREKNIFMCKQELKVIPILHQNIQIVGHVYVDRKNPRDALKKMDVLKQRLDDGNNVLFFPEGTRSLDGTIQPFKRGLFVTAIEANKPILPVFIDGTGTLMKKGSKFVRPTPLTLKVGKPIYLKPQIDNKKAYSDELKAMAYDAVVALKDNG